MSRYKILTGNLNTEPEKEPVKQHDLFGFDNGPQRRKRWDYFRLGGDEAARISILYENVNEMFTGAYVHFSRHFFLCKGKGSPCCEYGKRMYRIGCVVLIYPETDTSVLTEDTFYEIKPWTFPERIFTQLRETHKTFPITGHDLGIKCKMRNIFRDYEIMPLPNSVFNTADEQIKGKIMEEAKPIRDNMEAIIAPDLSIEQIRELNNQQSQSQTQQAWQESLRTGRVRIPPTAGHTGATPGAPVF